MLVVAVNIKVWYLQCGVYSVLLHLYNASTEISSMVEYLLCSKKIPDLAPGWKDTFGEMLLVTVNYTKLLNRKQLHRVI